MMVRLVGALLAVIVACGPGHTSPDRSAPVSGQTTTTVATPEITRPVGGVTKEACWEAGLHAAYVDAGTWSGSGQIICVEAVNPWPSD